MYPKKEKVRKILAVRNDRFGEFLLNLAALRALKETFSNAKLIIVVSPYLRELAETVPFVDEIIEWEQKRHSLTEKLGLINLLRKKKIDIAIMLNPSREFNIFSYLSGIPIRVGYNRKWGFLLTHKIEDKKYLGQRHEIDYNLELVSLIGAETKDKTLSLKIEDSLDAKFRDLGIEETDNLVALHPWTSDPIKQWPIAKFIELAELLLDRLKAKVIIIGGKEELIRSAEIFSHLDSEKLINLTGKTTLRQLAVILKKCRLLISADSGPVHLASCVGTPVIAIFRSDIPGKSATRWGPSSKGSIVIEEKELARISADEVFEKARSFLE